MTGEVEMTKRVRSMHPQKFAMWLFLVSVVMVFISLSSAYIVKKSVGEWEYINFPPLFKLTTVLIIISSFSMQFAYVAAKRNNIQNIMARRFVLIIIYLLYEFMTYGSTHVHPIK